jgi:hypothetical protein
VYEAARGRWKLGPRADREQYALFTAMGIVVLAIEIDSISQTHPDGRRTISGAVLKPGNPVYDTYVDGETPVSKNQNPVQYFDPSHDRTG